ncbi:MAG: hypothetical protein ACYCQI_00770 [Gammaproteobacteria bacterium]
MLSTAIVAKGLQKTSASERVEAKIPGYRLECDPVMKADDGSHIVASFNTSSRTYIINSKGHLEIWDETCSKLINKIPLPVIADSFTAWDSIFVIGNWILLNMNIKRVTIILNATTFAKIFEQTPSFLDLATAKELTKEHFFCQERGKAEQGINLYKLTGEDLRCQLTRMVTVDMHEKLYRKRFILTSSGHLVIGGLTHDTTKLKLEMWSNQQNKLTYAKTFILDVPIGASRRWSATDALEMPKRVPNFSMTAMAQDLIACGFIYHGNIVNIQVLNLQTEMFAPISGIQLLHPPLMGRPDSEFILGLIAKNSKCGLILNSKTMQMEDFAMQYKIRGVAALANNRFLIDTVTRGRKLISIDPERPEPMEVKEALEERGILPDLSDLVLSYLFKEKRLVLPKPKQVQAELMQIGLPIEVAELSLSYLYKRVNP